MARIRALGRNRWVLVAVAAIITVIGGVYLVAEINHARSWRFAVEANTPEAYERYMQKWPDGEHFIEARQAHEDALWRLGLNYGSIRGWERFLTSYSTGPRAATARRRIAQLQARASWSDAKDAGTIVALEQFIVAHPNSEHVAEAHRLIQILREDESLFRPAEAESTPQASEQFLLDERLRQFLQEGGNATSTGLSRDEILLRAAREGRADLIRLLLTQEANPRTRDAKGNTPLHLAAEAGHPDAVDVLLGAGISPDVINEDGATPLLRASLKGQTEVIERLLESGATVNRADEVGFTPLHVTAQEGKPHALSLLLDHGADLNARIEFSGLTPLHLAAFRGQEAAVAILLQRGAEVNAESFDRSTAFSLAIESNQQGAAQRLRKHGGHAAISEETVTEVQAKLKSLGFSPGKIDGKYGHNTAAAIGMFQRHRRLTKTEALVPLVLDQLALLQDAIDQGDVQRAKRLANEGAKVTAKNSEGRTPMEYAETSQKQELIEQLRFYAETE